LLRLEIIVLYEFLAGIDLCIDLCFGLDMILSFQTAYFDETSQKLVFSRKLIIRRYTSGWLSIDLVSTVPIDKLVIVAA